VKVIFLSMGTKGDILPFLGLAREFHARGHSTVMMSSAPYQALAEAEYCEFVSLQSATEMHAVLNHPDAWKHMSGLKLYIENFGVKTAAATLGAIEQHAASEPSVIVCNNLLPAGFLAAEKLGLPLASVFLAPYAMYSIDNPAREAPLLDIAVRGMGKPLRKLAYKAAFRTVNSWLAPLNLKNHFSERRFAADLVLGLWPEWFCPGKSDWPTHALRSGFVNLEPRPANWSADNKFLSSGPLVFTMGSEMMQNFKEHVKLFSSAARALGKKGILVSPVIRGKGRIAVNNDFVVYESAPFTQLFPFASVIVNHGGIGTLAKGMASGRPQLVLPMAHDQFDNGYQVERLGVGRTLPFRSLTGRKLVSALSDLISNPAVAQNCRFVAHRMRKNSGVTNAADLIETHLFRKLESSPKWSA